MPACLQIDDIEAALRKRAAYRLRCCFSKCGFGTGVVNGCWCYARDDDGKDVTLDCNKRTLVVGDGIGDARYSYRDEE
jgi:hypothetical protein